MDEESLPFELYSWQKKVFDKLLKNAKEGKPIKLYFPKHRYPYGHDPLTMKTGKFILQMIKEEECQSKEK